LYDYYKFDTFLNSAERTQNYEFQYDRDAFKSAFNLLFVDCSLRQLDKIMSSTRLILRTLNYNNYLIPVFFPFLIFIKFLHCDYYDNIVRKKYSLEKVQNKFYEIIRSYLTKDTERYFVEMEACLLIFYNNYISAYRNLENIFKYNKETSEIQLVIESTINNQLLQEYYRNRDRGFYRIFDLNLEYFINRIELSESFKM